MRVCFVLRTLTTGNQTTRCFVLFCFENFNNLKADFSLFLFVCLLFGLLFCYLIFFKISSQSSIWDGATKKGIRCPLPPPPLPLSPSLFPSTNPLPPGSQVSLAYRVAMKISYNHYKDRNREKVGKLPPQLELRLQKSNRYLLSSKQFNFGMQSRQGDYGKVLWTGFA